MSLAIPGAVTDGPLPDRVLKHLAMHIGEAGVVEATTVAAQAACRTAVQKLAKVRQVV